MVRNPFLQGCFPSDLFLEDTLTENKGECVICLDDLLEGQKIARLPCLCIYHKR